MWPSGYYIRPKGIPLVSPVMKVKEVRSLCEWEIKNEHSTPNWNEILINNEWMEFMTPSNAIMEDTMKIGLHGKQVTV